MSPLVGALAVAVLIAAGAVIAIRVSEPKSVEDLEAEIANLEAERAFHKAKWDALRKGRQPGFFDPWVQDLRDARRPENTIRHDLELLLDHWDPDEGTALRWSLEWCARNHDRTYR